MDLAAGAAPPVLHVLGVGARVQAGRAAGPPAAVPGEVGAVMAVIVVYQLQCDGCGNTAVRESSARQAWRTARARGWTRTKGVGTVSRFYCPDCTAKRQEAGL